MSQKWTLHDATGALPDYTFSVNPNQDSPTYQKNLQFQALVTPGSLPLLFEGQDNPTVFSVQGTILSEDQYTKFVAWYNLRHQILLTDDRGGQRWIYLTEFQPVRKRSALYPWRYDYTLSGFTISETFPSVTTPTPPSISAPTVSGISPTLGTLYGGTSVVITGTNFVSVKYVTIGGTPVPFTVNSSTQITATSPSGATGTTAHIEVTNVTGTSSPTSADLYSFVGYPIVSALSPVSGALAGGTSVVITGSGFTGATQVAFGSINAASFTVNSDSQITAVTASESAAEVEVVVTTPVGNSGGSGGSVDGGSPSTVFGDEYSFLPVPVVSSVSPTTGTTSGGTAVTVNGSGFLGATSVMFGTNAATFTLHTDSWITATSPSGSAGTVDITVITPGGTSATSSSDHFTYS